MSRLKTLLGTVLALALALAVLSGGTTNAGAAPAAPDAAAAKKKSKKVKVNLKKSAKYSHVGQPGVKVTAQVKKNGKKAKGKVKFYLGKKKIATKKLKKGKASTRLSRSLKPGNYTVKAKYGKKTKATKVRVYDSSVRLSGTSFTVSKSTDSFDHPDVPGIVKFRGKAPSEGYVDIYQDGKNKKGSQSPFYCCDAVVGDGGAFTFFGFDFLGRVAEEKPVGTYRFQAFYTPNASFDEYIYSSFVTVTVVE